MRKYNFSAGPAVLPEPVLEEARDNLLSLGETGIGILEHSHRGKAFLEVYEQTVADIREVGNVPDEYDVLFLQGGASTQFCMAPMNFLSVSRGTDFQSVRDGLKNRPTRETADYLITGSWSKKAIKEAKLFGNAHTVCSSEDRNFCYIPKERDYSAAPAYVHFTSNNTIFGTQFREEPELPDGAFLACDASSDIFSRPIDVTKYGIIYAGSQKNLGPAGVTLVIIRKDLVERGNKDLPTMLQYRTHAEKDSMFNTPPTFPIYVIGLVIKWLKQQGGLSAMAERNQTKADKLYSALEDSDLFQPTADPDSRSLMNVTFITGDAERDAQFVKEATAAGFDGLKGHRSVGGMRASIYNAFPPAGVDALVEFLREFERRGG